MDRFVWFVLLVVFSHLVTEFTRVTGYTRGSRHDSVMVNDSLIQPIRVQNQIQYPGQEYGHYDRPDPPNYNANSHYSNYNNDNPIPSDNTNANSNNNNNNNNNMLTNFFNGLFNQNNNNNNGPQLSQAISNPAVPSGDVRTFGFIRPIIDSIFEIPISTLRAVNNLVGRLTFSYRQQQPPQQQQHHDFGNQLLPQQQLQYLPRFTPPPPQPSYYGIQRSAGAIEPKSEFEMLNRIRQNDSSPATAATTTMV